MEKFINAFEVRSSLDEIVEDILTRGEKFVIERDGSPVAVIVPIEVYQQWKRSRERFFEVLSSAQENANFTEETAFNLVDEAVKTIRAE